MAFQPEHMMAAVLMGHGGFDKLELHSNWPVPKPQAKEVLIRVTACGINNTDLNTRIGWYSDQVKADTNAGASQGFGTLSEAGWGGAIAFPRIQGADCVGRVVALGEAVPDDWLGARVMSDCCIRDEQDPLDKTKVGYIGSEFDGGFAQFVALPLRSLAKINSSLSDAELATFACAYTTAENMLSKARLSQGECILITGASGGVGSALIQLAKLRGATVIAVSSTDKTAGLLALGADYVLAKELDDWEQALSSFGQTKVDVIADVVGQPVFSKLLNQLKKGGRYVCAGAIGGKTVTLDLSHLYLNDWELLGATVANPDIFSRIVSYIEKGVLKPLLAKTYPLQAIHKAQEAFLKKEHLGKLVILVAP